MEGERKRKGFVARCNFHIPAWREEWPAELTLHFQKDRSHWCCCPGVQRDRHPSPALHPQGDRQEWCFLGPLSISGRGMGTTPHGTLCLWGIKLIPLSTNWQPQAPLEETDTAPIGRSWKKPLHSSPQRQFEYLNMPQTDCPCQWLLVQDVAQLWLLKQSTACYTVRSLCCNADFK